MTYSRPGLSRGARRAAQERPSRSRPGRPRRHEPTRRRANGPKRRERSDSEREATANLTVATPPPTRVADMRARDPAAPLGRNGRPERGPDRPAHHDSSNTGPTRRRLGPLAWRFIGRSSGPSRTTEKTDSDCGGGYETGNRADNLSMKSRSAGTKWHDATSRRQGP